MDRSGDGILATWILLSRMRVGDKLSIQGTELVNIDRSSLFTGMRRSMRGDTREALLTWIPELVSLTAEAFDQNHMTQYHERTLKRGMVGLLTLRDTYSADVSFVSRLEVCLDKLRSLGPAQDIAYFSCESAGVEKMTRNSSDKHNNGPVDSETQRVPHSANSERLSKRERGGHGAR